MQAPHFDAAALRQARPAVPLAEIRARRTWPVTLMLLAVLAGLAGGVIGGLLSTGFLRQETAQPSAASQETTTQTETAAATNQQTEAALRAETAATVTTEQPPSSSASAPESSSTRASKRLESSEDAPAPEADNGRAAGTEESQAALRSALGEWLAATNERNLGKQLSFYHPTMDAFYTRRNARIDEVRADRARVFENAHSIDVRAEAPVIRLSRDGQSATMRFLKRYAISGGGEDRAGEVVQELRWQRVKGRWRIISERDVRVLH